MIVYMITVNMSSNNNLKSRGDHHKFKKAGAAQSVIVPGKRSDDLAPGTLGAILRKTGLRFK